MKLHYGGAELLKTGLRVEELAPAELAIVQHVGGQHPKVSLPDDYAFALASSRGWTLLAGDGELRAAAHARGIECFGVLWLCDQMFDRKICEGGVLLKALEGIAGCEHRGPSLGWENKSGEEAMKKAVTLSALGLSVGLITGIGAAVAEKDEMGFIRVLPGQEQYKSPFGIGPASAVLYGDPTKPGIYVVRIHWPKNMMSRPHTHAQDRHVVVLSGTWWTGTGKDFDPSKAVPLKAGGYMMHPAGAVHWDGSKDEEAVIQITGMGPVSTDLVDPKGSNFSQQ